jgi:hypothetical protein
VRPGWIIPNNKGLLLGLGGNSPVHCRANSPISASASGANGLPSAHLGEENRKCGDSGGTFPVIRRHRLNPAGNPPVMTRYRGNPAGRILILRRHWLDPAGSFHVLKRLCGNPAANLSVLRAYRAEPAAQIAVLRAHHAVPTAKTAVLRVFVPRRPGQTPFLSPLTGMVPAFYGQVRGSGASQGGRHTLAASTSKTPKRPTPTSNRPPRARRTTAARET